MGSVYAPPIGRRRPSALRPPAWPIVPGSTHARDEARGSAQRSRLERSPTSAALVDPSAEPVGHSRRGETAWRPRAWHALGAVERSSGCHKVTGSRPSRAAARSVLTCTPIRSASTGSGKRTCSSRCVTNARARASTFGGGARRPASHVRYDSGNTPSMAANEDCDWPRAIRHSRSVRGFTSSHHAFGAGRCKARGWRGAYFSQPILEGDRSLCSPGPSPLVPRQWAQSPNSLGKWRARQDSNLRPSA